MTDINDNIDVFHFFVDHITTLAATRDRETCLRITCFVVDRFAHSTFSADEENPNRTHFAKA